ncbi:ATP-dependent zinc metalloprotease FtsH [Pseudoroseomonas wenyumeiae]|uniref:ATP-dependent zinc metalloprotease FtsH n=1 Tax=Teichococcus wenyumeiae TaxID=2478470 RepID=A0A3A9JI14_9PROT|nr:ATP-dependent metallopeptidase FtsH/Yme1/Tma family protein [Pseudoroseomonas wenyumeiae]RMI19755.1 ATP-dependent zinc metalloprotease FtsH [Pseudoroseomonas wenyumeiae]
MMKKSTFTAWYWVAALFGLLVAQYVTTMIAQPVATIPYSQFQQLLQENKIAEVGVSDRFLQGELKEPLPGGQTRFATTRVEPPEFAEELSRHGVRYTGRVESNLLPMVLSWIVPVLLFVGAWLWIGRRIGMGQGGLMQIGKSKAKVYVASDTGVTFSDVAGVDEAKEELREIVDFLREPERYRRLGGRMPKGVLLVGPPGTGKTLLAKAVAGEAKVPFFSISGAEFVEMFVGVGAARVRDLFEQARARAPAIIFIDELDALGRARGVGGAYGGHSEAEQTLNQLLVEMDGFDSRSGLVILAATNRPEILDPALLRAGRFDRQVLVDRPDRKGRVDILQVHMHKVTLAPDVDAEKVAALTPGFTGADLANLVNEAALLATRRGGDAVTMADFSDAVERIVAGLERRNRLLNPKEREIVAYHEMGHALVALALPGMDPVQKVSIIPRGIGALGYTVQLPTEDRFLMTREELERKMMVMLGGRAAELIVFGHLSTGAANDLERVTETAHAMVARYGMSERLGSVTYERDPRSFLADGSLLGGGARGREYGEAAANAIDEEVRRIVDSALERTVAMLRERRDMLDKGAHRLLEMETLDQSELAQLVGHPLQAGGTGRHGGLVHIPPDPARYSDGSQPVLPTQASRPFRDIPVATGRDACL